MGKQALDGVRLNAFAMDPEALVIIGLDTDDGPEHPLHDVRIKLVLDEPLIRNIMVYGVLEPVLVTKVGDRPCVVDGRQRVRASREASKRLVAEGKEPLRVPVMVVRGDDATLFGVAVSANENRTDDGPMEKAKKTQRFLSMGKTEKEAAVAFGVTVQTIGNWMKLFSLDGSVRKAVANGELSASAAIQWADLSVEKQREALVELKTNGAKPTVSAAKGAREKGSGTSGARPSRPGKKDVKAVLGASDSDLHPEFVRGVKWMVGQLDANEVEGLIRILASVG